MQTSVRSNPFLQDSKLQYHASVVGGPVVSTLPPMDIVVLDDDPTTGDITYQVTDITKYEGKIITVIKKTDTTGYPNKIILSVPAPIQFSASIASTLELPEEPCTVTLTFTKGTDVVGTTYGGMSSIVPPVGGVSIYTGSGVVSSNRVVDQDDKTLSFVMSNPNSTFTAANQVFPFLTDGAIGLHIDPTNFQGSGVPGAVIGYQKVVADNDSVAILLGEVPGVKSAILLSENTAANLHHQVFVTDTVVQIHADDGINPSSVNVAVGSVELDSVAIKVTQPPPTNVASTELMARNTVSGELELMPVASLPVPSSTGGFSVTTTNTDLAPPQSTPMPAGPVTIPFGGSALTVPADGWNDGGLLNLATGVFSVATTGKYLVSVELFFKNTGLPAVYSIAMVLNDITSASNVIDYSSEYFSPSYGGFGFQRPIILDSTHTYRFRITEPTSLSGLNLIGSSARTNLSVIPL